jgi:hypothetical protein
LGDTQTILNNAQVALGGYVIHEAGDATNLHLNLVSTGIIIVLNPLLNSNYYKGTEVSLAIQVANALASEGINVRYLIYIIYI